MRFPVVPAIFLACTYLAGCASSSGPDTSALAITPSKETTSSVTVSAPVPAMAVGETVEKETAKQEELAWAAAMPETHAFDGIPGEAGVIVPLEKPAKGAIAITRDAGARGQRMQIYGQKFRDAHPINFGKRTPRHYAVHGVDVSRWQGEINWPKLRSQGANFAYIKATDGGDHLDPMFRTNWKRAKEAGLKRGAYHFFYWCRVASSQAEWFIRNVPKDPDALPPVIDVEYNGQSSCKKRLSRAQYLEKIKVFADMLERHYGKRPVIYTAPDFYADNLAGELKGYPFWLRSVAAHPAKRYPNRKWVFWQYSGSGLSHGVDGQIDLNVFNGSVDDWHNWLYGQSS
ncbi:glycoside hydrolase family 25 protein [Rhizobium sp. TRM95111]|uniref:glycoside hydrolase family 25 protein n=1 Tax=Rhizobium alarense TaxID=2846851 RepID=UPI001F2A2C9B|nr:glycoside hydrolase family 25 protein [Rhizobium alarense]MCF3642553.1 glycoside hydrolase family 25 protein [Rhizobium alarense]